MKYLKIATILKGKSWANDKLKDALAEIVPESYMTQLEKTEFDDKTEIKTWLQKHFIYLFTGYLIIASSIYLGLITFTDIPKENIRFADTILGVILGTVITTVINYYLGTSVGSQRKQETLDHVVKNAN